MPWPPLSYSARCLRSALRPSRSFSFTPNQRLTSHASHVPSFREQVARTSTVKSFSEQLSRPSVRTQVLFVLGTTVVVFCEAARWTNLDTYYWSNMLQDAGSAWQTRSPSNDEMRRARYFAFGKVLQTRLTLIKDGMAEWPQAIRTLAIWSYIQAAQPVLDAAEGRRMCWAVGAANTLVWLAWQFPRLQPAMARHFVHSPLSGRSYTLFTSMFSHRNIFHLVAVSMALSSFGSGSSAFLEEKERTANTRESTLKWHLLAFLLSAGLVSGLTSHVAAARITFPRLVARLRPAATAAAPASAAAGVGASQGMAGAAYAALTLTALAFPDTELALVIPPTFPVPIAGALGAALAVDVLGVWRGWRRFNHWAHLGGAAYGAWYWAWGHKLWGGYREATLGTLPRELANKPAQA